MELEDILKAIPSAYRIGNGIWMVPELGRFEVKDLTLKDALDIHYRLGHIHGGEDKLSYIRQCLGIRESDGD